MTPFPAKNGDGDAPPLNVVFVIYPDIVLLDLAGPLSVFSWARHDGTGSLAYETAITSLKGGTVPTDTGVPIESEPMDRWVQRPIHTLVIVGGDGAYDSMHDATLVKGVAALAERSERVCSVCSGALILAAAGLLDGRRATTHWEDCALLADSFPDVQVDADPIYVRDGHVWTSAGVTAGTDMALAIVADDLGQEAALERAQKLVTYMVRPGGQSQFSPALERQKLDRSGKFRRLHQWIEDNLKSDLRVEHLAERENMSVRSFHRRYTLTMGTTPAKAVERIRTEAARELLETTSVGIKSVAHRCGFGDEERMRRTFMRLVGVSPSAYRQRFRIGKES
ncbi:MAG: helix-turn-helix domain-containing protein [Pseudomonadota bacterium]